VRLFFSIFLIVVFSGCTSIAPRSLQAKDKGKPTKQTSATLGWDASTNATGYALKYNVVGGSSKTIKTATTSCSVSPLQVGQTYQFSVMATNYFGSSDWSPTVSWKAIVWP